MSDKEKSAEDPALLDERLLRTFAKISDPRNAQLFTEEAARKAFAHVTLPKGELAQARGKLDAAVRVLQQREERLANIAIRGSALGMLVAFVLAVLAIVFMR